jgi:hypothetical protein
MNKRLLLALAATLLAFSVPRGGRGQTLSPPNAEYRVKANGMLELRNDGDVPLAAILEVSGFSIDEQGEVAFHPPDPGLKVNFGSNSFTIPPRQSHFVFYKAPAERLPAWFAIVNNLTRATPVQQGLRINIVLPHFVYIAQKQKFRKGDLQVRVVASKPAGEYRVVVTNTSQKLGRVDSVRAKGFDADASSGGIPVFPGQTRWLTLKPGRPKAKAEFRIRMKDGYHFRIPFEGAASP